MNKTAQEPIAYATDKAHCFSKAIQDLELYLTNNAEFRFSIYDRREIQCIADRFELSADRVRSELKKLGYELTNNGHGRKVWKSKEAERKNYIRRIELLEQYISKRETRQIQFYDKSEIGRIAKRLGVDRDSVRASLRRKGYKLTMNVHGIPAWMKP